MQAQFLRKIRDRRTADAVSSLVAGGNESGFSFQADGFMLPVYAALPRDAHISLIFLTSARFRAPDIPHD